VSFQFDPTISLSLLLSVSAIVVTFFRTRRKAVDDQLSKIKSDFDDRLHEGSKRMDRHDVRITAVETDLKALPAKDDIYALKLDLAGMSGELREMRASIEGNGHIIGRLEKIVTRHEDHLLDGGKK